MKYKVTRPVFYKGCNYMTGQMVETESELISSAFEKIAEQPEVPAEQEEKPEQSGEVTPEEKESEQPEVPAVTSKSISKRRGRKK